MVLTGFRWVMLVGYWPDTVADRLTWPM